ncbi:probable tubulin polyglutamylase ttll-15 [Daktulosphaira vitifoliae]|uniref:probable tubulin polyglutamylase ttll-15 n=1 Tax=Daktulosphaira vitifoliae TaxID=58002 RepID=UPI0021AA100C|nr:probable tubulin polyglutamylase ttll-15 [Daktulosphaira vitifoliae]
MRARWFSLPFIVSFLILMCFILLVINFFELSWMQMEHNKFHHAQQTYPAAASIPRPLNDMMKKPIYSVFARHSEAGHLRHVYDVFDVYGYTKKPLESDPDWNVLWAHEYPFKTLADKIVFSNLKPYQKVNHFPGIGFISNKVDLATSDIKYIPPAFQMPSQKSKFLSYAKKYPNKFFVQKQNNHRGIKIKSSTELDFNSTGSFIQEYIDNPLLIDGYKFDIGVYTIITSIDPLRVYMYNGDILFRFCPEKYHPFDPNNVDKYVIGDDYLPTWNVPSLKKYYVDQGASMKVSVESHLKTLNKDATKIWNQLEDAIRVICLEKEPLIKNLMKNYKSKTNFFEMARFDFVVDDNLNVFIMEVNMSPNLSSAHYPQNRLLYEQVLFNLFALVGLTHFERKKDSNKMIVSMKNIVAYPKHCSEIDCNTCQSEDCKLCLPCIDSEIERQLTNAYREHIDRHDCKRIFPPTFERRLLVNSSNDLSRYNQKNQLMYKWFKGKCIEDVEWC